MRLRSAGALPLYTGGFLGPFGGGVVAVIVLQLRDAFDATTAGVAASIPAYLVPFAVLQLVSGLSASGSGAAASCAPATSPTPCCRWPPHSRRASGCSSSPARCWLPLYHADPRLSFAGAAALAAVAAVAAAFILPLRVPR